MEAVGTWRAAESELRARTKGSCPKNRARIGPNSRCSLTKLFVLRDSVAKQLCGPLLRSDLTRSRGALRNCLLRGVLSLARTRCKRRNDELWSKSVFQSCWGEELFSGTLSKLSARGEISREAVLLRGKAQIINYIFIFIYCLFIYTIINIPTSYRLE